MSLSLNPHEFSTHPETGVPILVRTIPYTRISKDRGPPVFLQQGMVYSEGGGKAIPEDEWPSWLPSEIQKLTPQALEECGFQGYVQKLNKSSEPPKESSPLQKTLQQQLGKGAK